MGNRSNMGFDFGLDQDICFPRKNRWLLQIEGVCAEGVNTLPPSRGARPSLSFKEIEVPHINETIYIPGKPDWKPVNLTLYDFKKNNTHPVFEWIKLLTDPQSGSYLMSCDGFKKPQAYLELYSGCGDVIESWVFECVWPQAAEWGELDMASSDIITCDLTLRYDRAYIVS